MLYLNSLEDLAFPLPHGVIEAERERLSPAMADAELVGELRRNAASDRLYIGELEANGRVASNIIRDLQEDLHALESTPTLQLVETFSDPATPFAMVKAVCAALRMAGREPIMEWHGDGMNVWLTVSIEDAA